VIEDYQFVSAFTNTIIVTFMSVSMELVLGLVVAMVMARPFRGRGIFRAIMLLPLGIPVVVAASNMRYIFLSSGYLNEALIDLSIMSQPIDWLNDPLALFTVAVSDMWKVTPLVMLILLAGLESIPSELYEAAEVDGASAWQTFWGVILPLLLPVIIIGILIRAMDSFKLFDIIYLVTGGGPGNVTETISFYTYLQGFKFFSLGYTAAMAFLQLIVITVISQFFVNFQKRQAGRA
jgi:ABC-type sugar transport system permease subunit